MQVGFNHLRQPVRGKRTGIKEILKKVARSIDVIKVAISIVAIRRIKPGIRFIRKDPTEVSDVSYSEKCQAGSRSTGTS